MKTTIGKLRNITTGILHTSIGDVYEFLEDYTNEKGIMTHHLGSAAKALVPILQKKLPASFFDKEWQKEGLDEEIEIADLTNEETALFFESFGNYAGEVWDNIKDKTIVVQV